MFSIEQYTGMQQEYNRVKIAFVYKWNRNKIWQKNGDKTVLMNGRMNFKKIIHKQEL